ncbi:MAG: hypothetical protein LBS09_01335 [Bacteroidales bacterium]|nr:hypothetical protein [Bacteroidales bacterium]
MYKISILFLLAGCVLFAGCSGGNQVDTEHPAIVAYTSGIVSTLSPVRVVLTDDVSRTSSLVGEPADGLFDFSPSVKGKAYWISENIIEFTPDDPFQAGQEYRVTFRIGNVIDVKGAKKTFTFLINTIIPTFYYQTDGLSLYDKRSPNLYYLSGTVTVSDYIPVEKVKSLLNISSDKSTRVVKWEHDHAQNKHYFRIDSLRAGDKRYDIHLIWSGKSIDYPFDKEDVISVPAENEFELIDIQVVQSPEQYIICTFSAAIDEKQRIADYFSLSGNESVRFSIDLNIVKIYSSTHITGKRTLTIEKGLKSASRKTLDEEIQRELEFQQLNPEVKFVGQGVILPNSSGLHLTFQSVNYRSVDVQVSRIYENNILQFLQVNTLKSASEMYRVGTEVRHKRINLAEKKAVNLSDWNTFSIDLAEIISPEPGAIYRVKLRGADKMVDKRSGSDNWEGDYDHGGYYWDDDREEYIDYGSTYSKRTRNVLATDIGLTAKMGDMYELYVLASHLVTAEPMNGVQIKAYNSVNQPVGELSTDKNGLAVISCKEMPAVVVAQQGKQKSYLKIDHQSLSLSNFDVSGVSTENGLKGFIYGERGVWRPGDTLFLAFILEDKNKTLPANHPVTFALIDPQNKIIGKQVKTSGSNSLYRFTAPTSADALTGIWEARIEVGGAVFTKNLKVETVKPNRLKIDVALKNTPILSGDGLTGKISAHWLHGAIARNLDVRVNARITKTATKFKNFMDYTFEDASMRFYSEEKTLLEGKLNDEGELSFGKDIDIAESPGMLRVFLSTRVFEEGGDFSINEFSTTYSPYESYIGILAPKGDGYYRRLEPGQEHTFEVATVNETGEPVNRRNVDVEVYKTNWNWWWSHTHGEANYSSDRYSSLVYSATINTQNGKGQFRYKWDDNGYFVVKMTDPESGHVVAVPVYSGYSWWRGENDDSRSAATMLQLATDKPSYNVGEEAVITFPAAAGAKALVSVEAGAHVKNTFWVDCKSTEGRVSISTTKEMLPNVYVHISLIQPHAKTENDAPIRLYGVTPLMVEDPQTRLYPVINMPDVLKPEEEFSIKVNEKNGQLMSYTLAIVDDGLLDLTSYKTPDPWNTFYAREALGVRTWDIYDYVIGAYGGKIEQLFAIGGDAEMALEKEEDATGAQRFKPIVKYLGPFTVEKGKTNSHKIKLPQYVGSVRTMVVAANGQGYGAADKTTPVRKPLMTLATLPRVLGPGEEVWLPVNVFAMEDNIRQVNVEISANDLFTIEGSKKQSVSFSGKGDQTVYFKLKVKEQTGIGRITATVNGSGEKAEHSIELDVRNPNSVVYTFTETVVEAGKNWDGTYTLPGMKGTNNAVIEASSLPPVNLGRRLNYLLQYPHGCIEQTTSAVFPQLHLSNMLELNASTKQNIERNIKAGLIRLQQFITPQGGFGYWPGDYAPSAWGSNYGGHFILEAEALGYALPAGMKQAWIRYQTSRAANWRSNEGEDITQAYRLYTLALAKQPDLSAMNRLKEYEKLSVQAKWRLAAAYALAGKPETAKSLTSGISTTIEEYANRFNEHFGSSERDRAMILETLILLNDRTAAFLTVKNLSEALNRNEYWMGTQTTAYCLLAIAKYAAAERGNKNIDIEYTDAGNTQKATSDLPVWQADLDADGKTGNGKVKFKNNGQSPLFVRVTASGIPLPGNEIASAHELDISVRFETERGGNINVSQLSQGTDFKAIVTVGNPGRYGTYTNLALSQIFPSGWEIVNTRLNDERTASGSSSYDYIDIRDDRVYTYFSLNAGNRKVFVVQLSAAYRGRFYLPAFSCEAMYDASIRANTEGKWIEVIQ